MSMLAETKLIEHLVNVGNNFRVGQEFEALQEVKEYTTDSIHQFGNEITQSKLAENVKVKMIELLSNNMLRITEAQQRRDWCGMADYIQFDLISLLKAIDTQLISLSER